MRTHTRVLALALVLLAACGERRPETPGQAAGDTVTPSMVPTPGDSAMPAHDSAAAAGGTHLTLNPVGGGAASGMAMLTPRGTDVEVALSVSGAPASAPLQAHIHRGRCGADQGVALPLSPVTVAADGSGSSSTTVAQSVMTGEQYVQVHGGDGSPMLCADLPAGS